MLQLFVPSLEEQMVSANLSTNGILGGGAIDYTNFQITGFTASPGTTQQIPLLIGAGADNVNNGTDTSPITMTTVTINKVLITAPTVPAPQTFTVPINTNYNLTSNMVSTGNALTIDATATPPVGATVKNDPTDGIDVFFNAVGTYAIDCILTASGAATTPIVVSFIAYDPGQAIIYNVSSYSGQVMQTFTKSIMSYSVDGVNMSMTSTNPAVQINNSNINAPIVTMNGTSLIPTHVFIFTLSGTIQDPLDSIYKNILIYNFAYLPIAPATNATIYMAKGETVNLTPSQISNAPPTALVQFNTSANTNGAVINGLLNIINDGGSTVGYVAPFNTNMPSLQLTGNEPGKWDGFNVTIFTTDTIVEGSLPSQTVGSGTSTIINVNVETLNSLILTDLPIYVFQINKVFTVDLNQFIVNKLAVNYTGWQVAINGAAPVAVPSTIFKTNSLSSGAIQPVASNSVTVTCNYVFTGIITSQLHSSLSLPFSADTCLL